MQLSTLSRPYAGRSRAHAHLPLMHLDRKYYIILNDREFTLLSRLAILTKKGTQPCNYSNAQAAKELKLTPRTTVRTFSNLKAFGLIDISRGSNMVTNRGRQVRTIIVTAPLITPNPQ